MSVLCLCAVLSETGTCLFPGSCCGLSEMRFAVSYAFTAASSGPGTPMDEAGSRSASSGAAFEALVAAHRWATRGVNCHGERCLQIARPKRELSRSVAMVCRVYCRKPHHVYEGMSRCWKFQSRNVQDRSVPRVAGELSAGTTPDKMWLDLPGLILSHLDREASCFASTNTERTEGDFVTPPDGSERGQQHPTLVGFRARRTFGPSDLVGEGVLSSSAIRPPPVVHRLSFQRPSDSSEAPKILSAGADVCRSRRPWIT